MESLAQKISQFVFDLRFSDIPHEVIEKGKTCLINGIGFGLANRNRPSAKAARDLIKKYEPGNAATLIGCGGKTSLMGAAFTNAVLFHARGQEDTHGTSHLGTIVIPSVLAISEYTGASGKDLLSAVIIGYEVAAALGRDLTAFSTAKGFRASSIYGIIGAAAAVSKILGHNVDRIKDAFGMAAAFASGTTETFIGGTMEYNFENGMAARGGIMAALLPEFGMTGADSSLDGGAGFCKAFTGTLENLNRIIEGLGKTYEIMNVTFKPYPSCAFNQTPAIATFNLARKHDLHAGGVDKIEIRMNPYEANYPGINYGGPFHTEVQCGMSTAFTMAMILVDRKLQLPDASLYGNPHILSVCNRTSVIPDESIAPLSCHLTIWLKNGTSVQEVMDITPQYYCFDMEKVIEVIEAVHKETEVPQSATREMIEQIKVVETWDNVEKLMDTLSLGSRD